MPKPHLTKEQLNNYFVCLEHVNPESKFLFKSPEDKALHIDKLIAASNEEETADLHLLSMPSSQELERFMGSSLFSSSQYEKAFREDYAKKNVLDVDPLQAPSKTMSEVIDYEKKVTAAYKAQQSAYKAGNAQATDEIKALLVASKVASFSGGEAEYLKAEKEKFNKEMASHERHYHVIERVNNIDLNQARDAERVESTSLTKYLSHSAIEEVKHTRDSTLLSKREGREEKIELSESASQIACLGLTGLSLAVMVAEVASGNVAELLHLSEAAEGVGDAGIEGLYSCSEASSAITSGIVKMLQGEMKLGMATFGLGIGRLASSALTVATEAAPTAFSAGAAVGCSFMTTGLCFGMAGLSQYQIHRSGKTMTELNEHLKLLDKVIGENREDRVDLKKTIEHKKDAITNKETELVLVNEMPITEDFKEDDKNVAIKEIKTRIEEINEEIDILTKLSSVSDEELKEERSKISRSLLQEKAVKQDHTTSRNLWIKMGVASAAIATIAAVGLVSAATFGVVPIILGASIGGLLLAERYTSGNYSAAEKLKKSEQLMGLYDALIKDKEGFKESSGIDLNKEVDVKVGFFQRTEKHSIQDHLQDLIIKSPAKAKILIDKLNVCKEAPLGSKGKATADFMSALEKSESSLLSVKSAELTKEFEAILKASEAFKNESGIDLTQPIDIKSGLRQRTEKYNMESYLRDLILHSPEKGEKVLDALKACEKDKPLTYEVLKTALSEQQSKPGFIEQKWGSQETRGSQLLRGLLPECFIKEANVRGDKEAEDVREDEEGEGEGEGVRWSR